MKVIRWVAEIIILVVCILSLTVALNLFIPWVVGTFANKGVIFLVIVIVILVMELVRALISYRIL